MAECMADWLVWDKLDSTGGGFRPEDFRWGGAITVEIRPYFVSFGVHLDWRTREVCLYLGCLFIDLGRVAWQGHPRFMLHVIERGPNGTDRWNRTNKANSDP